jgi:hypothetical protein
MNCNGLKFSQRFIPDKASNWAVLGPTLYQALQSQNGGTKRGLERCKAEAYTGYSVVKEAGSSQTHK